MTTTINAKSTGIGGLDVTCDASGSLELQTGGVAALTIDTSQRTAFVAGTAAAPAITRTGDTNTGMFFPAADTIAFAEGGTEAMRLDANGNVGIGTASPAAKLQVASGNLRLSDGFQLEFGGNNNSISGANASNYLLFYTNNTERMRIDSSGNVLVNTTTAAGQLTSSCNSSTQNPLALIDTGTTYSTGNYYVRFVNSASNTAGSIQHTAVTTVAYATTSDERLKENIVDAPSALEKINNIKIRSFDWKEDKRHTDYGFIAQELYTIYPDAVGKGDDTPTIEDEKGTWQVEYGRLTPILVKAIQEQQAIINDLKARIETLESK